jgi:HK97 family phage major capsid protein
MNIDALKRDATAKAKEAGALLTAQIAAANADNNRPRTTEEVAAVEALMVEARALKARVDTGEADARMLAEIGRISEGMTPPPAAPGNPSQPARETRSLGEQFASDPAYRQFIQGGGHRRSGSWTSPMVELQAATLDTASTGGGPLIFPQVLPGIQPLLFKRLTIRDLLASGTTDSNAIIYLQEKTFTNAAAAVAEGAAKPESTLAFQQATSPVQKIAHWLPVTEEMLEDYSAIRSYIDARLRLGLELTEEDEILSGSGVAPHLMGLRTVSGLSTAVARGTDSNVDAILAQITAIATGALIQPDAIVLNPANWAAIQTMKNLQGNYMGTGPWAAPQSSTLWGLPVAVTPSMTAGVALVGAFKTAAQVFTKGGVRVEISNSHSDFFVKNLVAIRAEFREALAIYRPAGFGEVTGLS